MPKPFTDPQLDRIIEAARDQSADAGELLCPGYRPRLAAYLDCVASKFVTGAAVVLWKAPPSRVKKELAAIEKHARALADALPGPTEGAPGQDDAAPVMRAVHWAIKAEVAFRDLCQGGYRPTEGDDGTLRARIESDFLLGRESPSALTTVHDQAWHRLSRLSKELEALAEWAKTARDRQVGSAREHQGNIPFQRLIDDLGVVLQHFFGRSPESTSVKPKNGEATGPNIRFVAAVLEAMRENLTETDLRQVPDLDAQLQPGAGNHRIRDRIRKFLSRSERLTPLQRAGTAFRIGKSGSKKI